MGRDFSNAERIVDFSFLLERVRDFALHQHKKDRAAQLG